MSWWLWLALGFAAGWVAKGLWSRWLLLREYLKRGSPIG